MCGAWGRLAVAGAACAWVGVCGAGTALAQGLPSEPAPAAAAGAPACDKPTADPACFDPAKLVDRIVYCANTGRSYLFSKQAANRLEENCHASYSPADLHHGELHGIYLDFKRSGDAGAQKTVCEQDGDARLAPPTIIADVVRDPRFRPGFVGLRLIGGIYCERLTLRGIDVKFGIALDYSVLRKGAQIRNSAFATDLSFDGARIAGEISIQRSRIDGGYYTNYAIADGVLFLDSTIGKRVDLSNSLFLEDVEINLSKIGGDLRLEDSIVGQLIVLSNQIDANLRLEGATLLGVTQIDQNTIGGDIDVNAATLSLFMARLNKLVNMNFRKTEIRCAVNARDNRISGDLNVVESGFAQIISHDAGEQLSSWSNERIGMIRRQLDDFNMDSTQFDKFYAQIESAACRFGQYKVRQEARFDGNQVEINLCTKSFLFGNSPDTKYLSFSGTSVKGKASFSIWPHTRKDRPYYAQIRAIHEPLSGSLKDRRGECPEPNCLDLVNFHSGEIVIDLNDNDKPFGIFSMYMKFDRISRDHISCRYGSMIRRSKPRSTAFQGESLDENGESADDRSRMYLPSVQSLISWLEKADSTHPHAAVIEAFKQAGADATELKIFKARVELLRDLATKGEEAQKVWNEGGFWSYVVWLSSNSLDYARLGVRWALGHLRGYGYRPEYVVLYLIAVIILFRIVFWFVLGTIAFKSNGKYRLRPISVLFLFDRLIPVYHVREENYDIKEFYRWAARGTSSRLRVLRYWGFRIPVTKVRASEVRRIEVCLDGLKIVGVVLAVFLAAAINELVGH